MSWESQATGDAFQPGWFFREITVDWHLLPDAPENLAGESTLGWPESFAREVYSRAFVACELLDGVLLAVRTSTLRAHAGLQFDDQFDFHFYDMDFCRMARNHGARLGTWPLGIIHESGGAPGDGQWAAAYWRYLDKWAPGWEVSLHEMAERAGRTNASIKKLCLDS